MAKIDIKGTSATDYSDKDMDFISLTDMVRDIENGLVLIEKWLRNKNTIEFLGIWEEIYNPGFNSHEFEGIKNQAGLNRFALSVKQWVENQAVAGREPRQQGQYPRRSQCRPVGVPRQSLNPERAFHPARIAARGAAEPAEPDGYWPNETVIGGYRGTEAGREQQMTQRIQAEFVQQPVGLLLESLKTSLPGTELIEREWQACRHAGREGGIRWF